MSWQRVVVCFFLVLTAVAAAASGCGQEFTAADGGVGGAAPSCSSPADCPGIDTVCGQRDCKNGRCGMTYAPSGAACEQTWACDGAGNCVECVDDVLCDGGDICLDYQCVPATCDNGTTDGDETDVDCGGSCPGCKDGEACGDGEDCNSGYCGNAGKCEPCSDHQQCADGHYCKEGSCVVKKPNGDGCTISDACLSGFCVEQDGGVCCDSACAETCSACLEGKTGVASGSCALVPAASDPDLECLAAEPSTCGSNGAGCSGDEASCILYEAGTTCGDTVCAGGDAVSQTCDGAGTCNDSVDDCGDYSCVAAQCKTDCSGHGDCVIACNTQDSECLACSGVMPLPPNQPACPQICNGGCVGDVCQIVCGGGSGDVCPNTISCPQGMPCQIKCEGDQACEGVAINCNAFHACNVDCNSPSAGVCRDLTLQCGAGVCGITCGAGSQGCRDATVTCGPNACTASCASMVDPPALVCGESCDCAHGTCY